MQQTTFHMIGNAHIDPVWLWRYTAGITEALSTCRTAVSLLKDYPEFIFTRADAWIYEQIERYDPALFSDIKFFIEEGRWYVAGGWYVQPDCNFPTAQSFQKHASLSGEYLQSRFGIKATVGFNVDSFGHTSYLPLFLRSEGFDSYIFMRPMQHEMVLPANLFRWKSPEGTEVTAFRIQRSYNASTIEELQKNLEAAMEAVLPEVEHVLCFYGVGNHGGGPTAELIEWIAENSDSVPGATLEFSHPAKFFSAVQSSRGFPDLPTVEGELQYHAIGCYSAAAAFKRSLRRAEKTIIEAEAFAEAFADAFADDEDPDAKFALTEAWKSVLFNQFHDTLGGSSIAQAYVDAAAQIGGAQTAAENVINDVCFRRLVKTKSDKSQRIMVMNPFQYTYSGPLFFEPWLKWQSFNGKLLDSDGMSVPYQLTQQSALTHGKRGMVWMSDLDPRSLTEYRLVSQRDEQVGEDPKKKAVSLGDAQRSISNGIVSARAGQDDVLCIIELERNEPIMIRLDAIEDLSDTWSHGISSYDGPRLGSFRNASWDNDDSGPVMASLRVSAEYSRSSVISKVVLYADYPAVDLFLRICWFEKFSLAKLIVSCKNGLVERVDGIPGGRRLGPSPHREYPFQDWISLQNTIGDLSPGTRRLSIITPDCFSVSGRENEVGITLFRSPPYAWHDPYTLKTGYPYHFMDQGEHIIRVRFALSTEDADLNMHATSMHSPPRAFDWTRGMQKGGRP